MVTAVGNVSFHSLNNIEVTKAQLVTSGRSTPTPFPGTADPHSEPQSQLDSALPTGDGFALKAVGMEMFSHRS